MAFEAFPPQYPPVDIELVDRIVCKLKAQGIFDQFRKDCLADVDTKPAYQNLQQRVNGTVATFLATQAWQQDLNKTQLRESLRRHVQQGFLEVGVDRIVDQVVNPKVFTVFMPKVEDVVYDCLGIEKPKQPPPSDNSVGGHKMNLADLLPKDLDPVSPESGNLSFDEEETKDETNNNESVSKMDVETQDSQVSGISDLSSHMGDSIKEQQENNFDSNTIKSEMSLVKDNSSEIHFENFENLSEKIKQTETGHNPIANSMLDLTDGTCSKPELNTEESRTPKSNGNKEVSMEIDSVSNSTFEDQNAFAIKICKEGTPIRTISEDSLSSSSFNVKLKVEKSKALILENSTNSLDKSEASTLFKESSSDKEVKVSSVTEDLDGKKEEIAVQNRALKKGDEIRDKKHRDSSSSSSKTSRSNYDKYKSSELKQRSNYDSKDGKEKTTKEEKERDKDKLSREEKDKSTRHRDDRHSSSKDRHKEKDRSHDRNKDKEVEKKKDKTDDKDGFEKDKRAEKETEKDKYSKDKEKNDKERPRSDKESHRHERDKNKSEKYEREKEKPDKEKDRHDREKDKHDKSRRDKEKYDKEKKDKEKERGKFDSRDKERDRSEKEKERSKEKVKVKTDKESKNEKDKEIGRSVEEKSRDDKKKDSRKYEKQSSSSSKKNDSCKSEVKDKYKQNEDGTKDKSSSSKSEKSEDDKRERKRKAERCIDDIKLKEARRSWDRDSGGGNGKGEVPSKSSTTDYKVTSSSSNTKENRTEESTNQHKTSERNLDPANELDEPSDVDTILMKINSSIEESQNIQSQDEPSVKKPKIAKNIFEIRKIMQARKNLARQQMQSDKKKKENCDTVQKPDAVDSPSTTESSPHDKVKIREENKENIKSGQIDAMKSCKVSLTKGKFTGFLECDIEKSRNTLISFQSSFKAFCHSIGMDIVTIDNIECIDYSRLLSNEELLDDNLNKVKPRPLRSERRNTFPHDNQVNKAVENIMSGKNGCYVLLKDCNEVVEAMRSSSHSQGEDETASSAASKHKSREPIDKDIDSEVIDSEQSSLKAQERLNKRKYGSSSSKFSTPHSQAREFDVDLDSPSKYNLSPQQSLKQPNIPTKKGTCNNNRNTKPRSKHEQKEDEPSSPDPAISVVLSDYLNDTVLNVTEAPATVPLTEAMLDSLMRESSMIIEDEGFEDSDDSDLESTRQVESSHKTLDRSEELMKQEEFISHFVQRSDSMSDRSFHDNAMEFSDVDSTKPLSNSEVAASHCDISHPNIGFPESGCENKSMKRRNQRVCRSASQRYDNNDLYKPRPVLPQNSKRVRAPRSESSEEFSLRGQFESSLPKRSR